MWAAVTAVGARTGRVVVELLQLRRDGQYTHHPHADRRLIRDTTFAVTPLIRRRRRPILFAAPTGADAIVQALDARGLLSR